MKPFLPLGIVTSALTLTLGLSWATADDPPAAKAEPEAAQKSLQELQQNLHKAIRSRDPEEMNKAMEELQALLMQDLQRNGFPNMQLFPQPGDAAPLQMFQFGGGGLFGQDAPLVEDDPVEEMRKTMDETVKNFDKSIDEAQDEETKKSLRAARDNYKKTTEAELEKLAKNQPTRPAQPQMRPFRIDPLPMNGADPFGFFAPNLMQKPRLGVTLLQVPEGMSGQLKLKPDEGVMVNRVLPNSVAEKVGLERFDIILEFAGKPLTSDVQAFIDMVNDTKAGDDNEIVVLRNGERKTLKGVVLTKAEPQPVHPAPMNLFFSPNLFKPLPLGNLPNKEMSKLKMSVSNDAFTIDATQNDVDYSIEGTIADGKKMPTAITITEGDKTIKADSLEDVPAEYRKSVEQLLDGDKATPSSTKKRRI